MFKKIKIFFLILLSIFSFYFFLEVNATDIKSWIINSIDDNLPTGKDVTNLPSFFKFLKNIIYSLVWIIAIFMIVWIWVRISTARWNPDEFKKAWMHLLYLILWIFLVFSAVWLVEIVAKLNIL